MHCNHISSLTMALQSAKLNDHQQRVPLASQRRLVFFLSIEQKFGGLLKTSIMVDQSDTLRQTLEEALKNFKKQLQQKKVGLNCCPDNFTLRLARKDGKPKTDLPAFELSQKIRQCQLPRCCIEVINKNAVFEIKQVKKNSAKSIILSDMKMESTKGSETLSDEGFYQLRKKNRWFFFC